MFGLMMVVVWFSDSGTDVDAGKQRENVGLQRRDQELEAVDENGER